MMNSGVDMLLRSLQDNSDHRTQLLQNFDHVVQHGTSLTASTALVREILAFIMYLWEPCEKLQNTSWIHNGCWNASLDRVIMVLYKWYMREYTCENTLVRIYLREFAYVLKLLCISCTSTRELLHWCCNKVDTCWLAFGVELRSNKRTKGPTDVAADPDVDTHCTIVFSKGTLRRENSTRVKIIVLILKFPCSTYFVYWQPFWFVQGRKHRLCFCASWFSSLHLSC